MRICDLIKAQETYQAELGQTVLETVRAMVERNIGAVPVIHNGTRSTCLAEVMTEDPLTVSTTDDLESCMTLMRRHSFRHVPVCKDGHLVGMVSLRDILLHDLSEKDDEVRMMRAYIHSVPDA